MSIRALSKGDSLWYSHSMCTHSDDKLARCRRPYPLAGAQHDCEEQKGAADREQQERLLPHRAHCSSHLVGFCLMASSGSCCSQYCADSSSLHCKSSREGDQCYCRSRIAGSMAGQRGGLKLVKRSSSQSSLHGMRICAMSPHISRPVLQCKYVVTLRVLGFPPLLQR